MSLINFGSLFGIKIKAHYSLFFLVFLFAYSLAVGVFPFVAKGYSNAAYWVAGTITTCVFFFTILLHEITHALIARRFGISTTAIIIWLFGGVASLNKESATPGEEFKIGAGGPFSSLAIGGLLFGLGLGLQNIGMDRLTVVAVLW